MIVGFIMGSKKDTVIRFSVGEANGEVSSVWRIWFNKPSVNSTSDVYLAYRLLGGILKVSIHESGKIQYSLTGEHAKKIGIPNQERHIDKWDIQGRSPIFKIIVPFTELKLASNSKTNKIRYLKKPTHGNAVEIFLYITDDTILPILPLEFSMFEEHILNNGKVLSLICRDNPITEKNKNLYTTHKEKLLEIVTNKSLKGRDLRGDLFLNNNANERGFIDIAL